MTADFLSNAKVIIKDGAMGTVLESFDVENEITREMWSSSVLLSNMDLVQRVHKAYIEAGCDLLLTCTYQMYEEGCARAQVKMFELVDRAIQAVRGAMQLEGDEESATRELGKHELICDATSLFKSFCFPTSNNDVRSRRRVLVAGSLGPYGSSLVGGKEYTGDYVVGDSLIETFHAARLEAFVEQRGERRFLKVDFFLFETFPRLDEALGILLWMNNHKFLRTAPVCFSFVLENVRCSLPPGASDGELESWWDSAAQSVCLSDGNRLTAAVSRLRRCRGGAAMVGVGCNCCRPLVVSLAATALLRLRREETEPPLALLLCPNSGETFAGGCWFRERHTAPSPPAEERRSLGALQRILAQGSEDISTFFAFVLQLLRERPVATDWLFDVFICGACCRSTPDDISGMKKEMLQKNQERKRR